MTFLLNMLYAVSCRVACVARGRVTKTKKLKTLKKCYCFRRNLNAKRGTEFGNLSLEFLHPYVYFHLFFFSSSYHLFYFFIIKKLCFLLYFFSHWINQKILYTQLHTIRKFVYVLLLCGPIEIDRATILVDRYHLFSIRLWCDIVQLLFVVVVSKSGFHFDCIFWIRFHLLFLES